MEEKFNLEDFKKKAARKIREGKGLTQASAGSVMHRQDVCNN